MDRRSFLRLLGGAAVAAPQVKYFFAPIGGWKSDVIAHPTQYMHVSEIAMYPFEEGETTYWLDDSSVQATELEAVMMNRYYDVFFQTTAFQRWLKFKSHGQMNVLG